MTATEKLYNTPYGRKTGELLTAAMDAYNASTLYVTVTYHVSGKDDKQQTTISTKREVWGPFPDDAAVAGRLTEFKDAQRDWKTRHEGYNHEFTILKMNNGVPTLYRMPMDKGNWHPYRVFIEPHKGDTGEPRLNVDRSDTWGVQRGQEWLTGVKVEDLQPGDRISVRYREGFREETVVRVERVELYWFE